MCRLQTAVQYLRLHNPNTSIVLAGLTPRGGFFDTDRFAWPSAFTAVSPVTACLIRCWTAASCCPRRSLRLSLSSDQHGKHQQAWDLRLAC